MKTWQRKALFMAYQKLSQVQFEGRHTKEGQKLLIYLRNWVAEESGLDKEAVQYMAECRNNVRL